MREELLYWPPRQRGGRTVVTSIIARMVNGVCAMNFRW